MAEPLQCTHARDKDGAVASSPGTFLIMCAVYYIFSGHLVNVL